MVPDRKPSQEYPGNVGVPQGFFLLYINDFPDNVICNIAIHTDDTTFYSQCEHTSDFCLLELVSEIEFDLQDTTDWGRKWLVDFQAGKTELALPVS